MHCLVKPHFGLIDTNRLKVKGWEKICHENNNQNRIRVAVLIPEKRNFNTKIVSTASNTLEL